MILDALHRIANRNESLHRADAREVMSEVLAGKCSDAQIAALLVALHMKGETVEEIVGFAEAIRAAACCQTRLYLRCQSLTLRRTNQSWLLFLIYVRSRLLVLHIM